MKLVIAGGRNYKFTEHDIAYLNDLKREYAFYREPITEIVSGAATGADEEGEKWAESHDIPVKRFFADWRNFGKMAGPMRNGMMADYADAVVLFPGGKGTASMYRLAKENNMRVFDMRGEYEKESREKNT